MNKDTAIERMRELVAAKVPFVHQGRDFAGIDCVGALVYAFQYDGPVPAYPQDPVNGELERELRRIFGAPALERASTVARPFTADLLRPGDVVSMQYAGPVRHVAMLAMHVDQRNCPGTLSCIHTDAMLGRVTEHILDAKWLRRIMRVWRP
jgi:cell wall-associated NlpC family hydrolase